MEISRREVLTGAVVTGASLLFSPLCKPFLQESPLPSQIPTVELHRHFEAGLSPETIAEFAQKNGVTQVLTRNGKQPIQDVDPQNPDSIRTYYQNIFERLGRPDGFTHFLDSLGVPVSVMCTLENLEIAAYRQIAEQSALGSIHTELRGSPYTYQENLREPASFQEIIHAIRRGIQKAFQQHGASGTFIASFSRNKWQPYGQQVVEAVVKTHTPHEPVGLDIAGGPEEKFPPAMFEDLLAPAREADVPITVHAGEQSRPPDFTKAPPSFIRDAVEKLGARRIGHGTSLIADRDLYTFLRERKIGIECCPASNAALGYISFEHHPLKDFLNAKLLATANTDDPLSFGIKSVDDMLQRYGRALRLTPDDIMQMTHNGIETAFVTSDRRTLLKTQLKSYISSRRS